MKGAAGREDILCNSCLPLTPCGGPQSYPAPQSSSLQPTVHPTSVHKKKTNLIGASHRTGPSASVSQAHLSTKSHLRQAQPPVQDSAANLLSTGVPRNFWEGIQCISKSRESTSTGTVKEFLRHFAITHREALNREKRMPLREVSSNVEAIAAAVGSPSCLPLPDVHGCQP